MSTTVRSAIFVFALTLVAAAWPAAGHAASAPSASVDNARVAEPVKGYAKVRFLIRLSRPSRRPVAIRYGTVNWTGHAGHDYVKTRGTVVFKPGVTRRRIAVRVLPDDVDEDDQEFGLVLAKPKPRKGVIGARLGDGVGVAVISDDDPPPTVWIEDAPAASEGDGLKKGAARFRVKLSTISERRIDVEYATHDGSAVAGDYEGRFGKISFTPRSLEGNVSVGFVTDEFHEPTETFGMRLVRATNATLGQRLQATASILDDDPQGVLTIGDLASSEGVKGALPVFLSHPVPGQATVRWTVVGGTATADSDYTGPTTGTLTFDGRRGGTRYVTIPLLGDVLDEDDETVLVRLSDATGAPIADGEGVMTIRDNDDAPTLLLSDVNVTEGSSGPTEARVAVELSAPSGRSVTVDYSTFDGSASAGSDYTATAGTLAFAPGETSKEIVVQVVGDGVAEVDESFGIDFTGHVNVASAAPGDFATVDVTDDDA
jgi:hypothetical protein